MLELSMSLFLRSGPGWEGRRQLWFPHVPGMACIQLFTEYLQRPTLRQTR